jgi:hypothetical protein
VLSFQIKNGKVAFILQIEAGGLPADFSRISDKESRRFIARSDTKSAFPSTAK